MDLSAFQEFHLLRPAWLAALLPLWGAAVWMSRRRGMRTGWMRVIDPALFPALRLEADAVGGASPWPWVALAWTLAVLALAGPSWQRESSGGYRSAAAIVVVLDLSPSMAGADVAPNRIVRARYALEDLLRAARDARVGLVVFGDESYKVTPLTEDVATVRALLGPLAPDILPGRGDHLAPALQQAGQLLAGTRDARVIVVTDGFDDPAAAFSAAGALRDAHATLTVIGVGTTGGAPTPSADGFARDAQGRPLLAQLDPDRLRRLAGAGGGSYLALADLDRLTQELAAQGVRAEGLSSDRDVRVEHWRDGGAWLLLALLPLAAVLWRRGWL